MSFRDEYLISKNIKNVLHIGADRGGELPQYQKIGVDDPTRRAYITSLHVTDCNRNGKEEVWYALIANGKIVEIHGLENTPQGLKPLVLTDAFKSLIQLEKQVILLMTLSLEKQDPFQRHPPMGTSGMGSGNGGGGNYPAQYERIFDREGATMERSSMIKTPLRKSGELDQNRAQLLD